MGLSLSHIFMSLEHSTWGPIHKPMEELSSLSMNCKKLMISPLKSSPHNNDLIIYFKGYYPSNRRWRTRKLMETFNDPLHYPIGSMSTLKVGIKSYKGLHENHPSSYQITTMKEGWNMGGVMSYPPPTWTLINNIFQVWKVDLSA